MIRNFKKTPIWLLDDSLKIFLDEFFPIILLISYLYALGYLN